MPPVNLESYNYVDGRLAGYTVKLELWGVLQLLWELIAGETELRELRPGYITCESYTSSGKGLYVEAKLIAACTCNSCIQFSLFNIIIIIISSRTPIVEDGVYLYTYVLPKFHQVVQTQKPSERVEF